MRTIGQAQLPSSTTSPYPLPKREKQKRKGANDSISQMCEGEGRRKGGREGKEGRREGKGRRKERKREGRVAVKPCLRLQSSSDTAHPIFLPFVHLNPKSQNIDHQPSHSPPVHREVKLMIESCGVGVLPTDVAAVPFGDQREKVCHEIRLETSHAETFIAPILQATLHSFSLPPLFFLLSSSSTLPFSSRASLPPRSFVHNLPHSIGDMLYLSQDALEESHTLL